MTREERAKQYLEQLKKDGSSESIQQIVDSLNCLVFSSTKEPLTKDEKLAIIAEMKKQASGYGPLLEHADNSSILELIQAVKAKIESDKGNK